MRCGKRLSLLLSVFFLASLSLWAFPGREAREEPPVTAVIEAPSADMTEVPMPEAESQKMPSGTESGTISEKQESLPQAENSSLEKVKKIAEDGGLIVGTRRDELQAVIDDLASDIAVAEEASKAKDDENIAGIYIEAGQLTASYASLEEIRNAISDFKDSGKFVVAYSDIYSQGLYYLASVADKVYMNPSGSLDWKGISAQTVFFKDLLDKVGVKMQMNEIRRHRKNPSL